MFSYKYVLTYSYYYHSIILYAVYDTTILFPDCNIITYLDLPNLPSNPGMGRLVAGTCNLSCHSYLKTLLY